MKPTPTLQGEGTSERTWFASGVLDSLPVLHPDACRPPGRVVVVAPHPDDEVLGAGGALACWASLGTPILVVAVTDGEASHPTSPTVAASELAHRRARERDDALVALGIRNGASVVRLGVADGAVTADRVAEGLTGLLAGGDTVLAPIVGDGHPDHDAAAAGAARAAAVTGVPLWSYAVWLWHWAQPHGAGARFAGAVRVPLPDRARKAKDAAIHCFTTQVEPLSADQRDTAILSPAVLARFTRGFDVLWGPP